MSEASPTSASKGLLLAIALVSAAVLGVQVLQTRLFSVMLWHHLTYMVVTVTLLGFAASGTILALFPRLGNAHGDPRVAVSTCCSLFGITLVAAFAMLAQGQLDTLDIEKDRIKYFYLFLHYAYLVVPFIFAGLAIAISFQQYPASIHRTYFWNLLGSAVGSILFLLLIRWLGGPGELFFFASLGGVAGLVALGRRREHSAWPVRLMALVAVAIWPLSVLMPQQAERLVPMQPAPSKAQSILEKITPYWQQLNKQQDPDYPDLDPNLAVSIWTPLCRIDTMPMPLTPGNAAKDRQDPTLAPRGTVHVFQDGDAPTVIWSKGLAADQDYDRHFYGLGYRLVDEPRVLVIGPGGGTDVQTALHYGAKAVTAVDINGDTLDLVKNHFAEFTGGIYQQPNVQVVHSEGRSFLRRAGGTYDLIQMSGTDTYAALSSGSYIFSESYLYTEEAFDDFFGHLADNGVISIIRFRFEPPRETLKLVATAARALRRAGIEDPRRHFIVVNQVDRQLPALAKLIEDKVDDPEIRSVRSYLEEPLRYSFTIMRKTPFTADDVAEIEAAIAPMNSELVEHQLYYGAGVSGANTEYGRLLAAMAAGGAAETEFFDSYAYETEPATDDQPFFFNFHSFGDLELFGHNDSSYVALTGSEPIGLYILAALLLQTLLATLVLVIAPLFKLGFKSDGQLSRGRTLLYFLALGLAYMLVEISTIQRFVLYLGHPTYSLSAGLASFMLFSGLGSALAGRFGAGRRTAIVAAVIVIGLLASHAIWLPEILRDTLALSESTRVAITVGAIAPLAFAMGMPFPTGLALLRTCAPGIVPWAFGVNGAASVLASILAIVIAMQAGFTVVFAAAGTCYLIAALTVPRRIPDEPAAVDIAPDDTPPDGTLPTGTLLDETLAAEVAPAD